MYDVPMAKNNNLPGELTEKQKKFCHEYLKDFNQAQSAIRAGYGKKNARVMASKLMANKSVTVYLVELQNEIAEKHDLTPDGIILNLKNLRNKCINYMDGLELDDGTLIPSKNGPAYAMVTVRVNELMGQHIGMWPKKIELDHNVKFEEQKQVENQQKFTQLLDGFAAVKSNGKHKTPRLVRGGKKKTANS